jgi:16S rRNA (guanine527-N7)-methyltransferase
VRKIGAITDLISVNTDCFLKYYELLIDWNEKINLTAITEEYDVATKHFLDCLSIFEHVEFKKGASVIDVGTGAGFPAIVMGIARGDLKITMLDSLNKRINFLNEVTQKLSLTNMTSIHSRAEDAGQNKNYREKYDFAVSRAVANLTSLLELCLPFVKVGGYFIALKGPNANEEISEAKNAIKLLGGQIEDVINYEIPTTDLKHNLVVVKKISAISPKYPRKSPKPIKEPLK